MHSDLDPGGRLRCAHYEKNQAARMGVVNEACVSCCSLVSGFPGIRFGNHDPLLRGSRQVVNTRLTGLSTA